MVLGLMYTCLLLLFHSSSKIQAEYSMSERALDKHGAKCRKNAGHADFIPLKDFLNPENGFCDPDVLESMRVSTDRTVKVTSFLFSEDRPRFHPEYHNIPYPYSYLKGNTDSGRYGTGYVRSVEFFKHRECPCWKCTEAPDPVTGYHEILVQTSAVVVFDDKEAQESSIQFFYDSEDGKGVCTLRGLSTYSFPSIDVCLIKCATHDEELVERLNRGGKDMDTVPVGCHHTKKPGYIISHPHGRSKHVSRGTFRYASCAKGEFIGASCRIYQLPRSLRLPDDYIVPGREVLTSWIEDPLVRYYQLPWQSKWIFPEGWDNKSLLQLLESDYAYDQGRIKLPEGTMIELPGGERVRFPNEAKFVVRGIVDYLVYDIATCPGSAGAPIIFPTGRASALEYYGHSGGFRDYNWSSRHLLWLRFKPG